MALSLITPVANSVILAGDGITFSVADTYSSLIITITADAGAEVAYNSATGAGAGYSVVLANAGGTDTFTVKRDLGWNREPTVINVAVLDAGGDFTEEWSYFLGTQRLFPQNSQPLNPIYVGTLIITENQVQVRDDVGWIEFDPDDFNVADSGLGKVTITSAAATGGVGSPQANYLFDDVNQSASDPFSSKFKTNTVDPTAATEIYISDTGFSGDDNTQALTLLKAGNGIVLRTGGEGWALFRLTADAVDNGSWFTLTGGYVASGLGITAWSGGDELTVEFDGIASPTAAAPGGGAVSWFSWIFDDVDTSPTLPGNGQFKTNNATPGLETEWYIDDDPVGSTTQEAALLLSAIRANNTIRITFNDEWAVFKVSSTVNDTGFYRIIGAYIASSPGFTFADGDELEFEFIDLGVSGTEELPGGIVAEAGSFTVGIPTATQFRTDTATLNAVTEFDISDSLKNGGASLGNFLDTIQAGGKVLLRSLPLGAASVSAYYLIDTVTDQTGYTQLDVTWESGAGTIVAGTDYEFFIIPPASAGGGTHEGPLGNWTYDISTVFGDPGAGKFRLNALDPNSAATIYLNEDNLGGAAIDAVLDLLRSGDQLYFQQTDDETVAFLATVTSAADIGAFRAIGISVSSSTVSSITDGKNFSITRAAQAFATSGFGNFVYNSTTTAGSSAGTIRFNNANPTLATEMYLDDDNISGVDVSTSIAKLDGAQLTVAAGSGAEFLTMRCGKPVDNGTYWTVPISNVVGSTSLSANFNYSISTTGPSRSCVIEGFNGSYTGTNLSNWIGANITDFYSNGHTSTYGSSAGTPSGIGVFQNLPVVPYDGKITDVAAWYRPFSSSAEGEFWLYKAAFTDASSTVTITAVGKIGDVVTGGNNANAYDISSVFTSGNEVAKGEALIVLYKATASATSVYIRCSFAFEGEV